MVKKFFHSKNPLWIYILLLVCTVIIVFQNCNPQPEMQFKSEDPQYKIGQITAYPIYDDSNAIATPSDHFDVDQKIILELQNFHPDSKSFEWIITRGFETTLDAHSTDKSEYQTSFTKNGDYDIWAKTYKQADSSEVLTHASKKLSIGQQCSHIEILLIEGALKAGATVTFEIDKSDLFDDIQWRVNGADDITEEEDITIQNLSGKTLVLEVQAIDTSQECLTYRKKEFSINQDSQETWPHFDYVKPVDTNHPVILENNEIYKYIRTSQSKYIQVNIEHAETCSWTDDKSISSCEGGQVDITQDDLDNTLCSESIEKVKATYTKADQTKGFKESQYYKYCPSNSDFCYFGPLLHKPNHHYCRGLPITASDCQLSQQEPNYRDVNGECLPSCQAAGGTHTGTDCENTDYEITLYKSYDQGLCCTRTPKTSQQPQCNNDEIYGCNPGTAINKGKSNGYDTWDCQLNDDIATGCQKKIVSGPVVNGECDAKHYKCQTGESKNQKDNAKNWTWTCEGSNGGSSDQCLEQKKEPSFGACGKDVCVEPFCATNCKGPGKCHVKDVNGVCYPSCGYAALLAGWGHYGPDGKTGLESPSHGVDNPHTHSPPGTSCANLTKWTHSDWSSFTYVHGRHTWEIEEGKHGACCKRGPKTTRGWAIDPKKPGGPPL